MLRPNRQTLGSNMKLGTLRKLLPGNKRRDIDAFIQRGPLFEARDLESWNEYGFIETLQFICPDPTFYDPTLNNAIWSLTSEDHLILPFTLPFFLGSAIINNDLSVTYEGTWLSYPVITVVGPIEGCTIRNDTTDEEIVVNYIVSAGETLTINCQFGNKTVVSSTRGSILGSITGDLATFHLAPSPEAPAGVNTLNVTGVNVDVNSEISICWYTRYIGI